MSDGFGIEDYVQKENNMGEAFTERETIDGGAPYEPYKETPGENNLVKESDEKGFFVEPGGEGDVNYRSAETGQFVSEEEAEASPETTVKETSIHEVRGVNKTGSDRKLNKRSVLMNLHGEQRTDEFAYFEHFDEDLGGRQDGYYMPLELWHDLGMPDLITVVVYPRDMLN